MFKKIILLIVAVMVFQAAGRSEIIVNSSLFNQKNAKPGEKYTGVISVQNIGNKTQPVKAYRTDYKFNASGANSFNAPGTDPRSNAPWVSLSPSDFVMPPNGKAVIYYTVDVPNDPNLKGSYWSMIMVEPVENLAAKPVTEKRKHKLQFTTQIRFGVQIATDIGENIPAEIKILNRKIVYGKGEKLFQLDIENTGKKWVRPDIWAELFNNKDIKMGKFNGTVARIYPGCSIKSEIDLSNLPAGRYKTIAIIDCGDNNSFGGQYSLEIK